MTEQAALNTDRELWRKEESYYAPSIHVTQQGAIGVNVGGTAHVMPIEDWHSLAERIAQQNAEIERLTEALKKSRAEADKWMIDFGIECKVTQTLKGLLRECGIALKGVKKELQLSGNWDAKDYGWPQNRRLIDTAIEHTDQQLQPTHGEEL